MDDDDDFDYDDDYGFDDSDGEDEEVMREFELDDIRSEMTQNPNDAVVRLRSIAENYDSIHSINASLELLKHEQNAESFLLVVKAIVQAPQDGDGHTRVSVLESAWSVIDRNLAENTISLEEALQIAAMGSEMIRQSPHVRVYLKLLLCLIASLIDVNEVEKAYNVISSEFYPTLDKSEGLWVRAFTFDAKVLELEICACSKPVDPFWYLGCLESVSDISGVVSPLQKLKVDEARARWYVNGKRLQDARSLLDKTVRGYEDLQGLDTSQYLVTRSFIYLLLISTILGRGNFFAEQEYPSVSTMSHHHPPILHALKLSQAFTSNPATRYSRDFFVSLTKVSEWMNQDRWSLAADALISWVRDAFIQKQILDTLSPYSRFRWDSLASLVRVSNNDSDALNHAEFCRLFGGDGHVECTHLLNLVDNTLDRAKRVSKPRSMTTQVNHDSEKMPLPIEYTELKQFQQQNEKENDILFKWRKSDRTQGRRIDRADHGGDELSALLAQTLYTHRDAMLGS